MGIAYKNMTDRLDKEVLTESFLDKLMKNKNDPEYIRNMLNEVLSKDSHGLEGHPEYGPLRLGHAGETLLQQTTAKLLNKKLGNIGNLDPVSIGKVLQKEVYGKDYDDLQKIVKPDFGNIIQEKDLGPFSTGEFRTRSGTISLHPELNDYSQSGKILVPGHELAHKSDDILLEAMIELDALKESPLKINKERSAELKHLLNNIYKEAPEKYQDILKMHNQIAKTYNSKDNAVDQLNVKRSTYVPYGENKLHNWYSPAEATEEFARGHHIRPSSYGMDSLKGILKYGIKGAASIAPVLVKAGLAVGTGLASLGAEASDAESLGNHLAENAMLRERDEQVRRYKALKNSLPEEQKALKDMYENIDSGKNNNMRWDKVKGLMR